MSSDDDLDFADINVNDIFQGVNLDEIEKQAQKQVFSQRPAQISSPSVQTTLVNPLDSQVPLSQTIDYESLGADDLQKQLLIRGGENAILRSNIAKQAEQNNLTLESLNRSIHQQQESYQKKLEELQKEIEYAKTKSLFHEREAQEAVESMKKLQRDPKPSSVSLGSSQRTSTDGFPSVDHLFPSTSQADPTHRAKTAPKAGTLKKKRKVSLPQHVEGAKSKESNAQHETSFPMHSDKMIQELFVFQKREEILFLSRNLTNILNCYSLLFEEFKSFPSCFKLYGSLCNYIYNSDLSSEYDEYQNSVIQAIASLIQMATNNEVFGPLRGLVQLLEGLVFFDPDSCVLLLHARIPALVGNAIIVIASKSDANSLKDLQPLAQFLRFYMPVVSDLAPSKFEEVSGQVKHEVFQHCLQIHDSFVLIKEGILLLMSSMTVSYCASIKFVNTDETGRDLIFRLITTISNIFVEPTREENDVYSILKWKEIHRTILSLFTNFLQKNRTITTEVLRNCYPVIPSFALGLCWYHHRLLSAMFDTADTAEILMSIIRLLYLIAPADLSSRLMSAGNGLHSRFIYSLASCTFGDLENHLFGDDASETASLGSQLLEICLSPEELEQLYNNF
ncbi:ATRIP, ATR checkpoint kinase regulatory subunit Rad26 [Schizosaccharomyces osmophilus]|uniref:ATRIP, ATR checkpoint kinase regulatory subunit Rad26 n=1 Tax=Schizosaccharomyces osmophilus TaxID=2545709 RepID=A0AAE9WCT1_9SCHI|nr:ATRIP, ATR checkpoint kinase regulatory subunit Rad26 [Schizosaccharomyces osmophilus]WBW73483.1 ATRIP, ATR checkpoint kinase regulatory subunit Rad26 [Schizosaccharomyces osmophilus]